MELEFTGDMFVWRGPAPYHFVAVPDDDAAELEATSALVTYGWGMIPVAVQVGETRWTTSLWPKDGGYIVPIKLMVQRAERLEPGDQVSLRLTVDV